ncbi:MAG: helix-turn-helix transcriptional regulator [Pseudomonadota bacterium]
MKTAKKYVAIGQRLKALRLALYPDDTITDYAAMMGVNYTRYLNWESGLNRPQPDEAEIFCDKLGVNMDFIYRGIEAALPQSTVKALSGSPLLKASNMSRDTPD